MRRWPNERKEEGSEGLLEASDNKKRLLKEVGNDLEGPKLCSSVASSMVWSQKLSGSPEPRRLVRVADG